MRQVGLFLPGSRFRRGLRAAGTGSLKWIKMSSVADNIPLRPGESIANEISPGDIKIALYQQERTLDWNRRGAVESI